MANAFELIADQLADPEAQWSLGTFGAIAEFMRDAGEPAELVREDPTAAVVTPRGGIRLQALPGLKPVAFETIYPHLFLAHEVAHQWWGHAVGWKNYHEQWLSEGLAQYFAVLYAGTDRGQDVVRNLIGQMRQSAAQYSSQGPISLGYRLGHIQNEGRVFRAIEYNKSAVVLHMLRRLMGDQAFFAGIRRFYAANRFQKAGTDDFRAAMEAETPMTLARFFDRWITEAAIPRLNVTSRIEPSGKTAIVRIEQLGEPFDFPYTVSVQYTDGRTEDITIPVSEAVTDHTMSGIGRHCQ